MGEVEIDHEQLTIKVHSHIITYGSEASGEVTESIREEIETMWNEPHGFVYLNRSHYRLVFKITAITIKELPEHAIINEIIQNTDPRNNYFRIEKLVHGDISFVDGLRSNSGYFKLENLYKGSTTAAHEYGHTLGLDHPQHLDIRGQGVPGIMYPRGTLVDPQYQYDPSKPAGVTGGTLHPMHRKVRQEDIEALKIRKLVFRNNKAVIGEFTNVYHWNHTQAK